MNAIPRKQRAMVRKGIKAGLVGEVDDDIEHLYRAYSESVRNLGTPVFPKAHFVRSGPSSATTSMSSRSGTGVRWSPR